jgi:coenzyme F420-0:L-glutamate ligase / coenzyme F420-1:gamma-L-glutamate ligase
MIKLISIKSYKIIELKENLCDSIIKSVKYCNEEIKNKDVLVISSKVLALSQGKQVSLENIIPSNKAIKLGKIYSMQPELTELIIKNSDLIFGGVENVLLTLVNNNFIANAGIDQSNSYGENTVILWPNNPYESAKQIRKQLMKNYDLKQLGIIISDSHVSPLRKGVIGSSIGVFGIKPVQDCVGKKDLFNRKMHYTKRAIADQITSASHLIMGECDEQIPYVISRNVNVEFTNESINPNESYVKLKNCLFMNSLKNYFIKS